MSDTRYSIKDLEHFTHIKAHTIRIWEQRYNLLEPRRTETNIRYYNNDDLKKILNINLLYSHGIKISRIAAMSEAQILAEAGHIIRQSPLRSQAEIDRLIVAITAYNNVEIRATLRRLDADRGLIEMFNDVVSPLLKRIGELWQVNALDVAHEHFFSNLYREHIIHRISELSEPEGQTPVAVLFLHEHEEHELGLLLCEYILSTSGYRCIYLGQSLPVEALRSAIQQIMPSLILTTFISRISAREFTNLQHILQEYLPHTTILIGGTQAEMHRELIHPGIHLLSAPVEILTYINYNP